ncbi:MAG: universal stress protein [Deltaproteobacteria bacterium]|nr:universal stress protein [Deltaproteobacteria bacterium]
MKRFRKILYVNESNEDSKTALESAVLLAEKNMAELAVIDVIPLTILPTGLDQNTGLDDLTAIETAIEEDNRAALESMVKPYLKRKEIRVSVLRGKKYLGVIHAVLKEAYDLVIKPAENPTWINRLFGSEDLHLLRKCPCPVWIMKPSERARYSSILAAVDFNPHMHAPSDHALNRKILELAASMALNNEATLHIVHAWEDFTESAVLSRAGLSSEVASMYVEREQQNHRRGLDRLSEELLAWMGRKSYEKLFPRLHLIKGRAAKVIPALARDLEADVVVMGTVARTGISGLIMGNTAETIIEQLSSSLLAVKPDGFETPVKI